jgi:large subunit ribosomal protein L22
MDKENIIAHAIAKYVRISPQKWSDVDVDNLYISEIFVNQGPQWKRWQAVPMGRAARILKRTSHVHVYLEEKKGR